MLLRAALAAVALAVAPIQCGHTPEAELREDETPGDALWQLALQFHQSHDAAAEIATLKYLVDRYPASRWQSPARDELVRLGASVDAGSPGN
jgi:hypothetical protein